MAGQALGKVERTSRGFEIIHFDDRYGAKCSLQQSSLAEYAVPGSSAVWLGLDGHEIRHPTIGTLLGCRMHVDLKLAKRLVGHLSAWIETGSLKIPRQKRGASSRARSAKTARMKENA